MTHSRKNIVSVSWLKENLAHPDLVILDATLKNMPNGSKVPAAPAVIKGAREFNFDTDICDRNTNLPHMLPSEAEFEKAVQALGINQDSLVVCYDAMGIFSSPRAWCMFKTFGHDKVAVLDGGLPEWLAKNGPTQTEFSAAGKSGNFNARYNPATVVSADQVLAAIEQPHTQIIDARSHGRFTGQDPEPRAGLRSGHIPGACCLPFNELIENGLFKSKQAMIDVFQPVVNSDANQTIFSCGSGVTASVLALVADELGYKNLAVYDGSWAEWGARDDLPVEK